MTLQEKERFLSEAQSVIAQLDNEFDSHEFIKRYIYSFPKSYGILIEKHANISTAHGEIANLLRINSSTLNISKNIDGVCSHDIFGNDVQNAKWRKNNIKL